MMRTLLIVCTVALLSTCSKIPSSVEPAPGADKIRFYHSRHIKRKVECLTCHEEIYDAPTLENSNFRPAEEICMSCHKKERENNNCVFCHSNVKLAQPWPKRDRPIHINHEEHIERVDEDCARCHKNLPEYGVSQNLVPPMSACMSCHEHEKMFKGGKCATCHVDMSKYRLKPVSLFTHGQDWLKRHRLNARSSANTCATCHEQSFCSDCHNKTAPSKISLILPERLDRSFIHRNDFLSRHMLEAQGDPSLCSRCHGTSFCDSCHRSQNLSPLGSDPRDPHPRGWAFPGSSEFHGPAARNDIRKCAACHDQGARSICVECHKVGGIGGDPHPTSWLGKHNHSEIQNNGMCRNCHI